ncbi:Crp/Fnr family transcriptional regulator [Anaerocolumna sp. MB42-C2]|uniref:Crp/Fnr family transcriptional regulator n=1 Tax=Anaerocolumna sp. MB42-C2 TaxID=3070997 RepID=UPI0027E1583A|nr:Crp/Fnr family transcriptional regulator [Anaerocolumna sp. MB42-C2]WMJ89882.1 Crp/Fnr family transcriptional regulator [Anaerocolumna sp. MB42-C2]
MVKESNKCMFCSNKLCIHKVPIFNGLNQEDLIKISEKIEHKDYKKGEAIFNLGDKPDTIVIINEGSAKAYKYTPDGREQILYIFSEGDFFGEQYLLNNQTAAFTVEALTPFKACTLTKFQLQQLLFKYPDIALKIIEELGGRMARLEKSLQSMGVRSVDTRISSLLMDFSEKYGKAVTEGILIRLPLSREGMANYLGVTRETVSRKLSQMEDEGTIRSVSNKSILILDEKLLKDTADL